MSRTYQNEVANIIDYRLADTPYGFPVRSPYKPDDTWLENAVSFLGAAQTLGHLVHSPFPALVGQALSLNALNLGVAGAGPEFFASNERLIEDVNKTKCCVVQVMSGRSSSNRYFKQLNNTSVGRLETPTTVREKIQGHNAFAILRQELSQEELQEVINETLENYAASYADLSAKIRVPKILLWISVRKPRYDRDFTSSSGLLGDFPQLVDDKTLEKLAPGFDETVTAVSQIGLGRKLWDPARGEAFVVERAWGKLVKYDSLYSDPYLHLKAAEALVEKIVEMGVA